MQTYHDLEQKIMQALSCTHVSFQGDGYHHHVIVVSDAFEGQTLLARHRQIMNLFFEDMTQGSLHALTIDAWTPQEYANQG